MSSLNIKDLQVNVGDKKIIHGLSLDLKQGELHLLMGPNGSGKSSLAQALMGHPFYEANGEVKIDDQDILAMTPDERAKAGLFLAFQYPVEVPGVKVKDFLRRSHQQIWGQKTGYEYKKALDFFKYLAIQAEEFGLNPTLLDRGLNDSFSGGEKKQLEVFQLQILKPKFAILDETDSGLDIDALKRVAAKIEQIRTNGEIGLLVITHYQRLASLLHPTKVHVMKKGLIVESGSSDLLNKIEEKGYSQF